MGSGAHTAAGPTALCGRSSQVRQPVAAPLLLTTTPCVSRAQLGDHITERECIARTPFFLFLYSKQRVGPVFILKTRPTKRALPSQDAQWGCGACGQRACGRDCPKIVPAGVAATFQRLGVRRLA